jgi:hypothetical protein
MKYAAAFTFVLLFLSQSVAQTDFMPIGSVVTTEASALAFYGTAVFTSQKDTICNGLPCRKIALVRNNKRTNYISKSAVYFQQKGDSIFEYNEYLKNFRFLFKNRYNLHDSIRSLDTLDPYFSRMPVIYIDSVIYMNGITRYASRIKCRSVSNPNIYYTAPINLYDKLIPDSHWNFYFICVAGFYDGDFYTPLCYTDSTTSYHTPHYIGPTCESLSQPVAEKETSIDKTMSIFPNPAQSFISIKSTQTQVVQVSIKPINGAAEVLHKTMSIPNNIDINSLANGVYILTILNNYNSFSTQKLVIQH